MLKHIFGNCESIHTSLSQSSDLLPPNPPPVHKALLFCQNDPSEFLLRLYHLLWRFQSLSASSPRRPQEPPPFRRLCPGPECSPGRRRIRRRFSGYRIPCRRGEWGCCTPCTALRRVGSHPLLWRSRRDFGIPVPPPLRQGRFRSWVQLRSYPLQSAFG